jgi:RimJ/RimL family protein N-acetyltransferase
VAFRLETERLLIRPLEPEDRPTFTSFTYDPEVMRYVHGGLPYTEEEVDEFFSRQARHLAAHDVCMGALVEKASGRMVGICGTQPLGTSGYFEIGWWLAREVWGRGYATEGGGAAMRHVLDTLQHPRVVAIIDPPNNASKAVVGRLGMTYDRTYTGTELGHRKPEIVVDLFYRDRE